MATEVIDVDLPPTDETIVPKTLDSASLQPPETRLGEVCYIRERITEIRQADETRALRRNKIQRWIDGARPYSQSALDETGQSDRTNFNPREAESMADAAKSPYYSLIFRNTRYASVECSFGPNRQYDARWSNSISRNFHKMLDEWAEFDYNIQLKQWQMVVFGVGLAMFPDDVSWQWAPRKMHEFLVPDETPSSIDALPEAVYSLKISPVKLYKLIEKEEASKTEGWFPDRVKRAIIKVSPPRMTTPTTNSPSSGEMSEETTASLRRGDVAWNKGNSQIRLVGYLVKEFDGKISNCLLIDDPNASAPGGTEDELMLFKKVGQFECFDQVAQPFFHDIGTGEWHSVRALGPKIRDLTLASAQLLCTTIDGGMKGASMLLQAADTTSEQISQLIQIGGANIIPAGLTLQQNKLAENLEGPINVRHEVQSTLQTTSAQYLPRVSAENSEPTLGQAQLNFRNQQMLSDSDVDRYMKSLDRLYKEQLRRALIMGMHCYNKHHPEDEPPSEEYDVPTIADPAERGAYYLIRRCIQDGVLKDALDPKWICAVKATRGAGGGSPAMEDIATREMVSLLPTMEEPGKREALRDRAAFLRGVSNVDRFYPPFEDTSLPEDNAVLASIENSLLKQDNAEVVITPVQNHAIHFGYHFASSVMDIQALKAGARQPVPVLLHLHQALPHMRDHLMNLEGDETRKDQYEKMDLSFKQLAAFTDQLQSQVEASLKAQQQPQPQMDPKALAALAKVQGDLQIKGYKAKTDAALKAEKQRTSNHLKDLDSAFNMALKQRESQAQANQPQQPQLMAA